jgi:hypothetical protein
VVLPVEFVDNAVGKPHTGEQDCVNPTHAQHIGEYPQRRDNHLRTAPVQVEPLHALGYGHGPHRHGCEHPKAVQKEQKTKVPLHGREIWLPEGDVSRNKIVLFRDKPPASPSFAHTS